MRKYLFLPFLICLLCWSCEGRNIIVSATSSASVEVNVVLQPTVEINDSIADNEILLVCTIVNSEDNAYIRNAKVKVVGTDTPGNIAYSDINGKCDILLPIIQDRNAESIMFAIEVQHESAITKPVSELCNDATALKLLGISDPANYRAAYIGIINIGWNRLGSTLKCTIPLKMHQS